MSPMGCGLGWGGLGAWGTLMGMAGWGDQLHQWDETKRHLGCRATLPLLPEEKLRQGRVRWQVLGEPLV